jgi:hypothetical protein
MGWEEQGRLPHARFMEAVERIDQMIEEQQSGG